MEEKQKHARHRKRLRNQAGRRPDAVTDAKLMEMLLYELVPRSDTAAAAKEALRQYGGFTGIVETGRLPGFAPSSGEEDESELLPLYMATVGAACRRYLRFGDPDLHHFDNLLSARTWFFQHIRTAPEGTVVLMMLDTRMEVRLYKTYPPARDVRARRLAHTIIADACMSEASFLLLAFLHPDSFLVPTQEEYAAVRLLSRFCRQQGLFFTEAGILTAENTRYLSEFPLFPRGTFTGCAPAPVHAALKGEYRPPAWLAKNKPPRL